MFTQYWIHAIVIILFFIGLVFCIFHNSPVQSEDARIATGLHTLKYCTFCHYRVNPPLTRLIASSPLHILTPNYELAYVNDYRFTRCEFAMGVNFDKANADKILQYVITARIALFSFISLLLVVCTRWAAKQYGFAASILALLMLCSSPYILGNAGVVMEDVPSAAMAVAAVFCFHRWLKRPDGFETIIAGSILGLAELTKFTLLIFYPTFVVLWLLYRKPTLSQLKQLATIFLLSIVVINMGYLFEDTCKPLGDFRFQTTLFTGYKNLADVPRSGDNRFKDSIIGKLPVPLPTNFVQGIDTQRLDFERGLPSYLRGEWSEHGWWYYYLYALLIKTPLGTIFLFCLAITCSFVRGFSTSWRDEMVVLSPGLVLLAFVSSQTGFSVHSRYVIPALPFLFIWISKVGRCFTLRKRALSVVVVVLLTWSVASSLSVYPHNISYFNELAAIIPTPNEQRSPQEPANTSAFVKALNAGSRNGGRHLLDSNIDWGQDIFYLERWCLQHPEVTEIHTALSGSYPIEQTKIPVIKSPSIEKLQPGWYAISVNYLYGKNGNYKQFLDKQPAARIGYSIYVYHVRE